jgi:hypothetical protein
MLDSLAPGDVVTVTRIDRLARSTFDLFAIVAGRDVAGIGRQLRPQHIHHAPRHARRMSGTARSLFIGPNLFHCPVIAERPAIPGWNIARRQCISCGLFKSR